jgi:Dolichyl-phosphate-mannose-protein mannosyltransferase
VAPTSGTRIASGTRVWAFVLAALTSSRVLFMGAGALAATYLPGADPAGNPLQPPGFLNYWAHWDGAWYSEIATEGYGARAPESTAFFPLYPLFVRLGSSVTGGPAVWGVLISLLCTAFALFFIYRIAENLYGVSAARTATLALAFFPTAFFLNAVYTEALFLALTAGAVWAARVRGNLFLAGVFGALAAATRNLGVLLLIPLFFEWARRRRALGLRGLAGLALVLAGLVAYAVYLRQRFGDPLVFARQQSAYWERELTGPLTTLGRAWHDAEVGMKYVLDPATLFVGAPAGPSLAASNTLNLVFLVFFLLVMVVGFVVLPPDLSIYTSLVVLLPVMTPAPEFPLMSLPRFVLGAFPVFMVLGYLLSRSRLALISYLVLGGGLGVALTALFATWRWVA